jgi:hypothetical protein
VVAYDIAGRTWKRHLLSVAGLIAFLVLATGSTDTSGKRQGTQPAGSREEALTAPVRLRAIAVTSQIVKSVGGKHRYFFDIRNGDQTPFAGSVRIDLIGRAGTLGRETFQTRSPIQPGLGTSVYFDINTGPSSVHGEYGITSFQYQVREQGQIVASGGGAISSAFEKPD